MPDHHGHHDDDKVVLEIEVTRNGLVRSWHSPRLTKETLLLLIEHLLAGEDSMPDPQLHKDDDSPTEKGAA